MALRKLYEEWGEKFNAIRADVARAKLGSQAIRQQASKKKRTEENDDDPDSQDDEKEDDEEGDGSRGEGHKDKSSTRPDEGSREGQLCGGCDASETVRW